MDTICTKTDTIHTHTHTAEGEGLSTIPKRRQKQIQALNMNYVNKSGRQNLDRLLVGHLSEVQ